MRACTLASVQSGEALAAIQGLATLAEKTSTFEEWERIFWMTVDIARAAGLEMTVRQEIDTEALAELRERRMTASILSENPGTRPGRRSRS